MSNIKLKLIDVQSFIIFVFVFLGPLGNLLTPRFFPTPFRTFYFTLVFFPLFFFFIRLKELRYIILFLPFVFYVLISGYITEFQEIRHYTYPFFRSFLFACECLLMFGMVFACRNRDIAKEGNRLIQLYLYAFFISLLIGYMLYIGFYSHKISQHTLFRFSVETQFGYGILRFSPGSYPNEYGIISSFSLTLLTFFISERKNPTYQLSIPKWILYLFYTPTFLAFILATTRAAYLAFIISLLYLFIISSHVRRSFVLFFLSCFSILFLLRPKFHDLFKIIFAAIETISLKTGTSGMRIQEWLGGLSAFDQSALFGTGWGTSIDIHNAYLQILYELGIIGTGLLLAALFIYTAENFTRIRLLFSKRWMHPDEVLLSRVIVIGLIHISFFALTNHNLNHHLTWFIFFLFNLKVFYGRQKDGIVTPLIATT